MHDELDNFTESAQDSFERIRGIGPVYTARLQAAGIKTFVQLAGLTPDQLTKIVRQGKSGPLFQAQAWIEQASQLASDV